MTAAKHTPGPWTVRLVKGSYQQPAQVYAGGKLVAACLGDQLDPAASSIREAEANARLIAVSTDLLDIAEAVAAHFAETDSPLGARARAVLDKVKDGA